MIVQNRGLTENIRKYIITKLKPGDLVKSMKLIEKKWKEIYPEYPFKYFFMDHGFYK